jgi:cytochrome c oxidase cbb3-type subunit III
VFRTWCASATARARGVQASGYPNLLDDDWLWGGDVEAIYLTVAHGIRNDRPTPMRAIRRCPPLAELLSAEEIDQVVQYVRQISGQEHDAARPRWGRHALCRQLRLLPHGERRRVTARRARRI